MLLLRPAIAALQAAGHEVTLLAPQRTASVLVRGGALRPEALLDAEAPAWSALATGCWDSQQVAGQTRGTDAAVVFSARVEAARALEQLIPAVVALPPWPPPGSGSVAAFVAAGVARWAPAVAPSPLLPHPADVEAVRALRTSLPSRFVALHPGSGSPAKNWPGFAALAARLPAPPLLVLGPAEEERGVAASDFAGAVLARGLTTGELAALLAQADLAVCNDSGVAHLAAAFGAPVLVLYGPTNADTWRPWGTTVRTLRAPAADLRGLSVETVASYVAGARTSV